MFVVRLRPLSGEEAIMRNVTCCLLVVLFGSWSSSLGQSAPKFTSPKIVATFERIGQTAGFPPTTLFTPQHWGTYRVSIVMVETSAGGEGYWVGVCNWFDGSGLDGTSVNVGTTYPQANNTVVGRKQIGVETNSARSAHQGFAHAP
jgi:hypothetical protein